MAVMRIDKYLSTAGIGSRSEVKTILRKQLVSVNGLIINNPGFKVDPVHDQIQIENRIIHYQDCVYYMLHKPAGVISATRDNYHKTVLELLPGIAEKDLFPVGRLDKDTEGLLLVTNDGKLGHALLSPRKKVKKVYLAKIDGSITPDILKYFQDGIDIGDEKPTLPAELKVLHSNHHESLVEVTIHEGRFHQIKRMFQACQRKVLYLKRLSMGPLKLDEALAPGEFRPLTDEEINALREL